MCIKISKVLNLPWCGIDLMRKGQSWVMIEVNSSPGMDFVETGTKKLYKLLLQYLIDVSQQWWKL
jgi:glutathione synthase/RimK-type ligase-like ATP-grasp enzyme